MEQTTNLKEFLTEIAEAIRIKREEYDELYSPQEFAEKILGIDSQNIQTWFGTIEKQEMLEENDVYVVHYMDSNLIHQTLLLKEAGIYDIKIAAGTFITILKLDETLDIWNAKEHNGFCIRKPDNNNFKISILF